MSEHLPMLELEDADEILEAPRAPHSGTVLRGSAPASSRAPNDRDFRAIYDAEVAFVWRNLRRLGVAHSEVDDKTQEVFVVAHRRFAEFQDRGFGARAWLFQIALRVASEARRHRRRHPEDPDGGLASERVSTPPDQASALALREEMQRLDRALERIDIDRRAVLVLHEIEEMTAPEIARILGISPNTVYSRLRVARAELELALRASSPGENK
ncbi:MAG: RNA polymerase sigma factor [Polyangiaceae bacterium]